MADLDDQLSSLDRPRALPAELRARLEHAVLAEAAAGPTGDDDTSLEAVDRPRPVPPGLRSRLEGDLVRPRAALAAQPRGAPALAIAAVILLLLGLAAVTNVERDGGDARLDTGGQEFSAGERRGRGDDGQGTAGASSGSTDPVEAPVSSGGGLSGDGGAGQAQGGEQNGKPAADVQGGVAASPALAGRASRSATVAVVHDDIHQYAGFLAHIDETNAAGDIHISVVEADADEPTPDAHLTVNLSARPVVGPDGPDEEVTTPLLETLTVTEADLGEGVYSFAPPFERVAHLAADELFPTVAAGTTAVVYYATPWGDAAAAAIEDVLVDRQVAVVRSPSSRETTRPPRLVPADAAFVVLPPAEAGRWLRQANDAGYRPQRGIAGLHSLLDERLLADAGDAEVTILSPYLLPAGADADRIREKITRLSGGEEPAQLSASAVHGWVTAQGVVEVVRRVVDGYEADLTAALDGLTGWDSGLFPPYAVRPDTHARTPEATVFTARATAFVTDGTFRRDPH